MIEINLVPNNLRKKENQRRGFLELIDIPKSILIGLGGSFLTVLILIHLFLTGGYIVQLVQQMVYKATWQNMLPDKKNVDSINEEIKELGRNIVVINDMTSRKSMMWSKKLNVLSDQLPKGLWFKKIIWDNNMLEIDGNAYSRLHDEITLVGNFVSNLKKDDFFMKDFSSIEVNSVTRNKRGSIEVADFKIMAKVR